MGQDQAESIPKYLGQVNIIWPEEHLWYDLVADRLRRAKTKEGESTIIDPHEPGSARYMALYINAKRDAGMLKYEESTVAIEDGTRYPCWLLPGDLWNGWEKPYFAKEVGLKIAEESPESVKYDAARDVFIIGDPEYPEETYDVSPETHPEIPVPVYGIGAGSWIWSQAAPDNSEFTYCPTCDTNFEVDDLGPVIGECPECGGDLAKEKPEEQKGIIPWGCSKCHAPNSSKQFGLTECAVCKHKVRLVQE